MKYVEEMQKEGISICRPQVQQYDILYMILISKHYPLIKWLVENDKIDREKVKEKYDRIPLLLDKVGDIYNCGVLKSVLMLLSISDTPIEDLLLYLK